MWISNEIVNKQDFCVSVCLCVSVCGWWKWFFSKMLCFFSVPFLTLTQWLSVHLLWKKLNTYLQFSRNSIIIDFRRRFPWTIHSKKVKILPWHEKSGIFFRNFFPRSLSGIVCIICAYFLYKRGSGSLRLSIYFL